MQPLLLSHYDRRLIAQDRLAGPMLYVMSIMVFLTVLAVASGLSLWQSTSSLDQDLAGRASVQIIEAEPDARQQQIDAAQQLLASHPQISEVSIIPPEEVEQLLSPWLGNEGLDEDIPIPGVIDIAIDNRLTEQFISELETQLKEIAPAATVTAHAEWLQPVFTLMQSLQYLAFALVFLLILTTLLVVVLTVNVALKNHSRTISVIHFLGGTDAQIARLFQRRITLDAAFGGLLGFVLAALVLILLQSQVNQLGAALMEHIEIGLLQWLLIAMVPIGAALLSLWTARITVMRALRKIL